jgi:hypothetical protein
MVEGIRKGNKRDLTPIFVAPLCAKDARVRLKVTMESTAIMTSNFFMVPPFFV